MILCIGIGVFLFAGYMAGMKRYRRKPMSSEQLVWQYTLLRIKQGRNS
jgi:hypothetical protein